MSLPCRSHAASLLAALVPALVAAQTDAHGAVKMGAHHASPKSDSGCQTEGTLTVDVGNSVSPAGCRF
jgi:hypothetical protein